MIQMGEESGLDSGMMEILSFIAMDSMDCGWGHKLTSSFAVGLQHAMVEGVSHACRVHRFLELEFSSSCSQSYILHSLPLPNSSCRCPVARSSNIFSKIIAHAP